MSNAILSPALAGEYVAPRVAPAAAAPAFHPPPPYPRGARWVTAPTDDGPGSLRQAIANALPGETIRFAHTLPPIILLRSTLVIDKDLTILGPGPQKLMLLRHFGAQTPGFLARPDRPATSARSKTSRRRRDVPGRASSEPETTCFAAWCMTPTARR